jgi:hypothetical protein
VISDKKHSSAIRNYQILKYASAEARLELPA